MSNHGVDLYRSDTGHYMEWPGTQTQAAAVPAQQDRRRLRSGPDVLRQEGLAEAGVVALPAPSRAWAYATRNTLDRKTLALTLVNWMILLMLLCTFLLAKTLPADTALSGTTGGSGVGVTVTH